MPLNRLRKDPIAKAYITSLLGIISGLLSSLWLLREILHTVTADEFGVYSFVIQLCAYINILQLSLDFAAGREISVKLGMGQPKCALSTFYSVKRYYLWIIFAGLGVLIAGYYGISTERVTKFKGDQLDLATKVLLIYGAGILLSFFSRPYVAALIGSGEQSVNNLLTVARTVFVTATAYILFKHGTGLLSIPIAEVISQFLYYTVIRLAFGKYCTWRNESISETTTPGLLRYAAMNTFGGLAWTVESSADVLIIGYFCEPNILGQYVLWWKFPQMLYDMGSRFGISAFPEIARKASLSKFELAKALDGLSYVSGGLAILALTGTVIWLGPFIQLWFGSKFVTSETTNLPQLFGLLVALRIYGNLLGMTWLAVEGVGFVTLVSWLQAVAKVSLGIALVNYYGIAGVAIASCVAALLQIVSLSAALIRRELMQVSSLRSVSILFVVSTLSLTVTNGVWRDLHLNLLELVAGAAATTIVWGGVWLMGRRIFLIDARA
jgi:O-antigen/teichoic acid export membrane protein